MEGAIIVLHQIAYDGWGHQESFQEGPHVIDLQRMQVHV